MSDGANQPNSRAPWFRRLRGTIAASGASSSPSSHSDVWWRRIGKKLIARKSLERLLAEGNSQILVRSLGAFDLVAIGIGAIIGTGIFVLTGTAAAVHAGPAIVISFIIAGCAAALAAFSYSELASMVPVSGGAYLYTYSTMGELMAWIIGWDLVLEYMVGAATVAVGWSGYIVRFFQDAFNVQFTTKTTASPLRWDSDQQKFMVVHDSYINIPAIFLVACVTILLVLGIQESKIVNGIVVTIKLLVVIIFIFAGIKYINRDNYKPFLPPRHDNEYGALGLFKGAQQVFFAYIGFDAVSTAAQETKNPKRDLPIGICVSLVVCTALYIGVSAVLCGIASYTTLNNPAPISIALVGHPNTRWLRIFIDLGAIFGIISVVLVLLYAQSRVIWAAARDGLLPRVLGRTHHRFKTPYVPTIICGLITLVLAGFLPVDVLGDMTSVGTLLAFALSHLGVIILRWTRPEVHRGFRVPLGPWVFPPIGIIISILLLVLSGKQTIARLFIWLGIGLVVYALFGYHRSRINNPHKWADLSQPEYDGVVKPDDVESNSKEVHHVYTEDSKIPSPPFDGYNDAAIADSHSISSSKQQVFANREPSPTARH